MHMDVVEEGWSSDDLAIRGSKEEEVEDRPVPSRSRASRKPPKTKGRTPRRKQEEVDVQDESRDFKAQVP